MKKNEQNLPAIIEKKPPTSILGTLESIRNTFYNSHFGYPIYFINRSPSENRPISVVVHNISIINKKRNSIRDLYIFRTCGLSHYFNNISELNEDGALDDFKRIELFLPLDADAIDHERYEFGDLWPIKFLNDIGNLALDNNKALLPGLLIPNGYPAKPIIPGSKLTTAVLLPPIFSSESFERGLIYPDGRSLSTLRIDFISNKEAIKAKESGLESLGELLKTNEHPFPINVFRKSYV